MYPLSSIRSPVWKPEQVDDQVQSTCQGIHIGSDLTFLMDWLALYSKQSQIIYMTVTASKNVSIFFYGLVSMMPVTWKQEAQI